MTITTTGLLSPTDCMPQYGISDDMVCSGRISGLDITDNGSTITIGAGSAYVNVVDISGTEMNVKVYLDADLSLTKTVNSDIIILVPLANVQQSANNTSFSDIASFSIVPTGTGGDFHLVLATTDASGNVSEVTNAGHYLPGCDFCLRCEGGVFQLPNTNINGNISVSGNSNITGDQNIVGDLNVNGNITGDISTANLIIPNVGLQLTAGETISPGDAVRLGNNPVSFTGSDDSISGSPSLVSLSTSIGYSLDYSSAGSLDIDTLNSVSFSFFNNIGNLTDGGDYSIEIFDTDSSGTLLYTTGVQDIGSVPFNSSFTPTANGLSLPIPTSRNVYVKYTPIGMSGNLKYQNYPSFVLGSNNIQNFYSNDIVNNTNKHFAVVSHSGTNYAGESASKVYLDNSGDSNTDNYIGISQSSGNNGDTIYIATSGVDSNQTGLTPYTQYYTSNIDGQLTAVPGGKLVGRAITSTDLKLYSNV